MHGGIALEVITRKAGRLQEFEALGRNVKWGPKIYKNNISNITNIFFIQLCNFSTYYFKHYFEIYQTRIVKL